MAQKLSWDISGKSKKLWGRNRCYLEVLRCDLLLDPNLLGLPKRTERVCPVGTPGWADFTRSYVMWVQRVSTGDTVCWQKRRLSSNDFVGGRMKWQEFRFWLADLKRRYHGIKKFQGEARKIIWRKIRTVMKARNMRMNLGDGFLVVSTLA